ncbi:hypothetical protein [Gluconobacter oxydans]|uniref:hypothetical protein n=1 Tax=Gluconobacter oxydans TaxID=442 RepID=UPI0002E063DA|nr:hypothetical protein [Gluconobacter oxydans]
MVLDLLRLPTVQGAPYLGIPAQVRGKVRPVRVYLELWCLGCVSFHRWFLLSAQ